MMAAIALLLLVLMLGTSPVSGQVQAISTVRNALQSSGVKPAPQPAANQAEGPKSGVAAGPVERRSGNPGDTGKSGSTGARGRDPFKVPVFAARTGDQSAMNMGPLPAGKRGLVIGQLMLKGIVRIDPTNVMIAVVTNYANRAYFLREQDVLFNGTVSKIMPDAVHFTENYLDPYGRLQSREVVKRLSQGPGEAR